MPEELEVAHRSELPGERRPDEDSPCTCERSECRVLLGEHSHALLECGDLLLPHAAWAEEHNLGGVVGECCESAAELVEVCRIRVGGEDDCARVTAERGDGLGRGLISQRAEVRR